MESLTARKLLLSVAFYYGSSFLVQSVLFLAEVSAALAGGVMEQETSKQLRKIFFNCWSDTLVSVAPVAPGNHWSPFVP